MENIRGIVEQLVRDMPGVDGVSEATVDKHEVVKQIKINSTANLVWDMVVTVNNSGEVVSVVFKPQTVEPSINQSLPPSEIIDGALDDLVVNVA